MTTLVSLWVNTCSVKLLNHRTGQHFTVTFVYGSCVEGRRESLWGELRDARGWTGGPWLIGGDFNITRFLGERIGREIHMSGIRGFNDLIRSLNIIKPPGGSFIYLD